MKLVALTSAALLAATSAFAGNLNYEAPADAVVDTVATEAAPSGSLGGSAAWLVPAVAVLLIVGAVSHSNKD